MMKGHPGPTIPKKPHNRNPTSSTAVRIFLIAAGLCIIEILYFLVFQEAPTFLSGIILNGGGDISSFHHLLATPIMSSSSNNFVVVAPTFYSSTQDTRYLLGLDACRQAAKYGIHLTLIDASPSQDVKKGLEAAGIREASGEKFVQVKTQTSIGKKGVALREGIQEALRYLNERSPENKDGFIGFQELEKVDLFRHWNSIIQNMVDTKADVCVPKRRETEFQNTYPIEQYHSEMFANFMLNSLGAPLTLTQSDWTNGPLAFRISQSHHWLQYNGELWDAQLTPLVEAHLAGAKVSSFEIDYNHPKEMKNMEQGVAAWNEKRLYQLNVLSDTVGKRMKEANKVSDV